MLAGERITVWIGKRGERQWFANEVETERRDLVSTTSEQPTGGRDE